MSRRSLPTIDPQAILRMGTLAGAEALGRDCGALAASRRESWPTWLRFRLPNEAARIGPMKYWTRCLPAIKSRARIWVRGLDAWTGVT